jgi:Heme exporter protein D (CcmD)
MNLAPFINGSFGITTAFLIGIGLLTYARYARAAKRLRAVETRGKTR